MNLSRLFLFSLVFLSVVSGIAIPSGAGAETITWNSEYYEAYAHADAGEVFMEDTQVGPPLPLLAHAYARGVVDCCTTWLSVDSIISATSMEISYAGIHGALHALGYTEFSGNYTADNPFFVFSYDYGFGGTSSFFIDVTDLSTSTSLFTQTINGPYAESGAYYIETPIGNDIGVNFRFELSATNIWTGGEEYASSVDYAMATAPVVPEPVSSILFITGGAALGLRHSRKKRKGRIIGRYKI